MCIKTHNYYVHRYALCFGFFLPSEMFVTKFSIVSTELNFVFTVSPLNRCSYEWIRVCN